MKQRATILCRRGDRILMVARAHSRWVLPGGAPHCGESLYDAALRELREETGLVSNRLRYLFRVAGRHKLHHVFVADIDDGATAHPAREIAHCAWVTPQALGTLHCSRPTPVIIEQALDVLDDKSFGSRYLTFLASPMAV